MINTTKIRYINWYNFLKMADYLLIWFNRKLEGDVLNFSWKLVEKVEAS